MRMEECAIRESFAEASIGAKIYMRMPASKKEWNNEMELSG